LHKNKISVIDTILYFLSILINSKSLFASFIISFDELIQIAFVLPFLIFSKYTAPKVVPLLMPHLSARKKALLSPFDINDSCVWQA
jgi:hypothetical protein